MKAKIILILLMTLSVLGGGVFLIDKLSTGEMSLLADGRNEIYTISMPDFPANKIPVLNELPSMRRSGRTASAQPQADFNLKSNGSSFVSAPAKSSTGKNLLSASYSYNSSKSKEDVSSYSASAPFLVDYAYSGGQSKTALLAEASYVNWAYSSSLMAPMAAANSIPELSLGNNNSANDVYNLLVVTEGAPVGDGLLVLLLFAGLYIVYRRTFGLK